MPPRTPLAKYDVVSREQSKLDKALVESTAAAPEPRVSVREARQGAAQVDVTSERETTRLLFISRDTNLLNQATQSLDGYVNLADVFDEVHIVILQPGIKTRNPVLRVAPNVWLYVVSAEHWWWTPFAALQMIEEQLHFADGFRPDVVVARDPYESGVTAYLVGKRYRRPTQLHILEDFLDVKTMLKDAHPRVRGWIARRLMSRFQSIRCGTDNITARIKAKYSDVPDLATLPRFHGYHAPVVNGQSVDLKIKYPQFTFIMVYVGPLDSDALAYQAMDAARALLRNPKIGLLFVGSGPGRAELETRAALLGITTQIAFEREVTDITNYIATADMLVVPDTSVASDETVIVAAFAGVPIVATTTPLRTDLFVHRESALLCPPGDSMVLGSIINQAVNDIPLRRMLRENAYNVVSTRLHEDPEVYRLAYRDSVEAALFVGEPSEVSDQGEVTESSDAV